MTDNGSLIIYDGDCIFCHPKLGRLMALLLRGRSLMTPPSLKPEHPQDGFVSLTAIGCDCRSRFAAAPRISLWKQISCEQPASAD